MMLDPPCYFCKKETDSGGSMTGADPFTHIIRNCKDCKSTQHFIYGTDTLLSFTLNPSSELYTYNVSYDLRGKHLVIYRYDHTDNGGLKWIPRVDTVLQSFPVWLAHDFISEHRINTLAVFS